MQEHIAISTRFLLTICTLYFTLNHAPIALTRVYCNGSQLINPLGEAAFRAAFYVLAVSTSFYVLLGPSFQCDQKRKWSLIPILLGGAFVNIVGKYDLLLPATHSR